MMKHLHCEYWWRYGAQLSKKALLGSVEDRLKKRSIVAMSSRILSGAEKDMKELVD